MNLEVRTERLRVRPLTQDDEAEFVRVRRVSESHFKPWFPEHPKSPEDIFMQELEKNRDADRHVRMGGELSDGRLVGFFNLSDIVRGVFQSAYASWSLSAECLGRGYATEGVRALLDLALSADSGLGLHRVEANIIPANDRSIRLATRVGMRFEGQAERYLKIAGRWQDHHRYAKTVEEHDFTYLVGGKKEGVDLPVAFGACRTQRVVRTTKGDITGEQGNPVPDVQRPA